MSETQQTTKHDIVYKIITHIVFLLIGIIIGYAIKGAIN